MKQGSTMGVIFILMAAIGFGAMALCANLAYANGVNTASLLMLRFMIAAVVVAVLARGKPWPGPRALRRYLGMGCVYALMAWSYFSALHYASSATVALLLYTFPAIVAVVAALLKIDRFGVAEALAVLCAVGGMLLLLGGKLQGNASGFAWALTSAACYATYILMGSNITDAGHPLTGSVLVLGSAGLIFTALALAQGVHLPNTLPATLAVVFLALFSTAMAIVAFVAGLGRIGPTLAAVLSTLEPVVTITLGIAFLGETLQSNTLSGGALILLASLGLTLARMRHKPLPGQGGLS
jgi:drug/metabolite transporter (DMT)-like permease